MQKTNTDMILQIAASDGMTAFPTAFNSCPLAVADKTTYFRSLDFVSMKMKLCSMLFLLTELYGF